MPKAVRIHETGGPETLRFEDVDDVVPGVGDVEIRQRAVGVNYIDVYHRNGLYKLPALPAVLGLEGAGEVTAVGPGVRNLSVGDRVAYAGLAGGYAERRIAPADRLVVLPDAISFETAAAVMLQGMTARYLLRDTFKVGPGTVLLFHAAAGGVGLIACQWAKALGATVIGTVGSEAKATLARENGCSEVINYRTENFVDRVAAITGGKGCDVVYDSVGADTFPASLDCLKPRGLWVSFGNASGPVPPFELTALKGSLFATRPSLFAYIATTADLLANAADLFDRIGDRTIQVSVTHKYRLSDASSAHSDLEARRTTGSIILLP